MNSLQETISQFVASFKDRMDSFEGKLHKGNPAATNISSLSADFSAFKTFTLNKVKVLQ